MTPGAGPHTAVTMPKAHLDAIYAADRALRAAERSLLGENPDALTELLVKAVADAKDEVDVEESMMRLERLADLCAQVPGPKMADALISILDDDEPSVRVAAGEALMDVAYDYYAEVARAVDRALDRGESGPAMAELPYVLANIGEDSAGAQLKRFMQNADPDVVAAAIEASVILLEPNLIPSLKELIGDERMAVEEDFEDETTASLGELAQDAIEQLQTLLED